MAPGPYEFAPPPPPPSNGPGGYTGHNKHGYSRHNHGPNTSGPRSRDRGHYNPGSIAQGNEYHQSYSAPNEPAINGTHVNNGRHTGNGNPSSNGTHSGNGGYKGWLAGSSRGRGSGNTPARRLPPFTMEQSREAYGHQTFYPQPSYGPGSATQAYQSFAQDSEQSQWNGPTQGSYEPNRVGPWAADHVGQKSYNTPTPPPVSSGYVSGYPKYYDNRGYDAGAYPPYMAQHSGPQPHEMAGGPHHRDTNYHRGNRRGRGGGGFRHHQPYPPIKIIGDDKPRGRQARHPTPNENVITRQDQALAGKKKKRKTDAPGLGPVGDAQDDSDYDEEAQIVKMLDGQGIQISDMTAYLIARKARFPTKARVEARKLADEKAALEPDKDQERANTLRRELRKLEKSIKRKRETGDNGDDQRVSDDDSSDDEKLGAGSSGDQKALKPEVKKADVSNHCKYYATGGTCGKKGKCRFVHDPEVRANAIRERIANGGRLTLTQRLVLNDKNQDELSILESLQHLRDLGLAEQYRPVMEKSTTHGPVPGNVPAKLQGPVPGNVPTKLLPVAPATLPAPPVKRETGYPLHHPPPSLQGNGKPASKQHYQGWNLKPYGNGNGGPKPDNNQNKVAHQ